MLSHDIAHIHYILKSLAMFRTAIDEDTINRALAIIMSGLEDCAHRAAGMEEAFKVGVNDHSPDHGGDSPASGRDVAAQRLHKGGRRFRVAGVLYSLN